MKKLILLYLCLLFLFWCASDTPPNEEASQTSRNILALWDSLTEGYGVDKEESYPAQLEKILNSEGYPYTVLNAGISGETSQEIWERVSEYTQDTSSLPGIVIITAWGNDGLRKMSIETMKQNITQMIQHFQEKNITVVLSGIKLPPQLWLSYSSEFNKSFEDIADDTWVYFHRDFLGEVYMNSRYNQDDMIHPTSEGNTLIATDMFEFLENEQLIKQ